MAASISENTLITTVRGWLDTIYESFINNYVLLSVIFYVSFSNNYMFHTSHNTIQYIIIIIIIIINI